MFETLTTVGYGDYTPATSEEYCIVIFFEFIGFCYNAILITMMTTFYRNEITFADLLHGKLEESMEWMKRLELSYKPYFMHPYLGK